MLLPYICSNNNNFIGNYNYLDHINIWIKLLIFINILLIYLSNNRLIKLNMPQLIPFYFVNQVFFVFTILLLLVYVFSKYILPKFVFLFTTRLFISKL